jgi:hypothetical protein
VHALWVLIVLFFVLRALRHRHDSGRLERRRWRGELSPPGEGWERGPPSVPADTSASEARPAPASEPARAGKGVSPSSSVLQVSPVERLQQDYVAGRITVEEYEAELDRLFTGHDGSTAVPASGAQAGSTAPGGAKSGGAASSDVPSDGLPDVASGTDAAGSQGP